MLYKEIMAGVKKATALAFVAEYNKRTEPTLVGYLSNGEWLSAVRLSLKSVGIEAGLISSGTANAVVTRMQRKAGVW